MLHTTSWWPGVLTFIDPATDTTDTPVSTPSASTSTTSEPSQPETTTEPSVTTNPPCSYDTSEVLGIYRITLWIIVLSLTILTTSLTSGFLWTSSQWYCQNYWLHVYI